MSYTHTPIDHNLKTARTRLPGQDQETSGSVLNLFSLLRIKEKFPYAFDDICLYSEVSHLLSHCMFRLTSRRFIQELFQDVQFMPVRAKTAFTQPFLKSLYADRYKCLMTVPPFSDVRGSRGNLDKATKSCRRGR